MASSPEVTRRNREERYRRTAENGGVAPIDVHNRQTYNNWKCRCAPCAADHAVAMREAKADRWRRTAANGGIAPTKRHGASTYVHWGCGCLRCVTAGRKAARRRYRETKALNLVDQLGPQE